MTVVRGSVRNATLLVALLAIAGACSAGGSASPTPSGPSQLAGTSWKLTSLGNAAPTSDATLTFTDASSASGLAGCNTFTASYTADASSLKFGPLALTRIACEPGVTTFESAYVSALTNTTNYTMTADQLTLKSGGGQALLVYSASAATDIQGAYIVTAYNNGVGAVTSVPTGTAVTMKFDANGQISGNGGCNQYSGPYTVDGANTSIGPLSSTMMACPDAALTQLETQFLAALQASKTWSLTGQQLELRGADNTIMVNAIGTPELPSPS